MNISQPNPRVSQVVQLVLDIARDQNQLAALKSALGELPHWPLAEVEELIAQLSRGVDTSRSDNLALETVLQALAARWQSPLPAAQNRRAEIDKLLPSLQRLYLVVSLDSAIRNYILRLMAAGGSIRSLEQFAENFVADPSEHAKSLGLAFGPLLTLSQPNFAVLFPRLLDGLQHRNVAAAILDVANHAFVQSKLVAHPAAHRAVALHGLLGNLVDRMSELELAPPETGPLDNAQQVVDESVALIVSVSRTLALIGEPLARVNLLRTLQLKHRRIRAEAAGALAALGDPQGIDELLALARWPVVRLRALAYADELGLIDRIDPRYRTEIARAESELAVWLAEPTQFGVAPSELHLLDERQLFWPGYEDAQACYLFRFVYPTAHGGWSNIGIAGPATHATSASLEHLSPDDIYALFAGWQSTHADLYEIDLKHLPDRHREKIARQQAALGDKGFADIHVEFVGRFFGDEFAVAVAIKTQCWGYLIWGDREAFWLADPRRQLSSELAYCIFKGQKLLANFNSDYVVDTSRNAQ